MRPGALDTERMAILSCGMICSLDGFISDSDGGFDWGEPDPETHRFVNERERRIGTYLYGRRMFDIMRIWQEDDWLAESPAHEREYADIWRATDQVVYSRTLDRPDLPRTTLRRRIDADEIRDWKESAELDLIVAGADLAAGMLSAGLVDEIALWVAPIVVGGGTPMLPRGVALDLDLVEERRLGRGFAFLRYTVRR